MPGCISHSSYKNSREGLWPSLDVYPRLWNCGSQHGGAMSEHGSSHNSPMDGQEGKCGPDNFIEAHYLLFWHLSFEYRCHSCMDMSSPIPDCKFPKDRNQALLYIFLCPQNLVFVLYLLNGKWCTESKLKVDRVHIVIETDLFAISSSQTTQVCR